MGSSLGKIPVGMQTNRVTRDYRQDSLVRSAEFFLNYCLFLSHNLAQKKAILSGNIEEGLKRYISDPPETPQECSREMLERLFSYVKKVLVYNL